MSLPEPYRTLLDLRFVQEQSVEELAGRLGLAQRTVYARLERGRALLVQKMEEEGYAHDRQRV